MKNRFSVLSVFAFLLGALVLTGCPPKKKLIIEEKPKEEVVTEEPMDENDAKMLNPGDVEINQDWTDVPALKNVQYGYNSASLDEASRSILKMNVAIIKKLPASVIVRVEGHCDDRGTVEYNVALGQRRANAVRSYYATAGIKKSRLESISFGEERPLCSDQTDACWARNRRGQTKVKSAQSVIIKASDLQ